MATVTIWSAHHLALIAEFVSYENKRHRGKKACQNDTPLYLILIMGIHDVRIKFGAFHVTECEIWCRKYLWTKRSCRRAN